jgi:peptidoglycan/LPS O-acetylase OafA/YrhL
MPKPLEKTGPNRTPKVGDRVIPASSETVYKISRVHQDGKHEKTSRNPELDGLRGLAILGVVVFHVFSDMGTRHLPLGMTILKKVEQLGWTGVDLFFVLSGFLITGILLEAKEATNYFKVFYMRRALRILPIYYVFIIFIFAISKIHYPFSSKIWFLLNISNLITAFYPYLIGPLTHFWTLAVEEQFYLLWPTVVRYITTRTLIFICVGGIASSILLRNLPISQSYQSVYDNFIYRWTPFRLDGLLMGAGLAVAYANRVKIKPIFAYTAFSLGLIGTLLTAYGRGAWKLGGMYRFGFTFVAIMYTGLLVISLTNPYWGRVVRLGVLRQIGFYSYCMYIIQPYMLYKVRQWVQLIPITWANHIVLSYIVILTATVAVTYATARVSWALLEHPILELKKYFVYKKENVLIAE